MSGTNNSFNLASTGKKRMGLAAGKVMGKTIANLDRGFDAFEKLGLGAVNDGLKLMADAVKAPIQRISGPTTIPYALSIKEGFQDAMFKDTENKPSVAQMRRSATPPKPAGPKLAPT